MWLLVSLLSVVALAACAGPAPGVVTGRTVDLAEPMLVMAVTDFELPGGASVERSGFAVGVAVRQAFASYGAEVVPGRSRSLGAALKEAQELSCASVIEVTIDDWNDSDRDWIANPDRLAISVRVVSVADGLTDGYGDEMVELANLQAARKSPFQLASGLAQSLVDALLDGALDPADVPGS
ncbi:MAG: hypothetical protein DRQ55_18515 [Planctomycetota bacterium]|nr:MAG: hypothetical protein DRQ55_18515 [Planctomycetota bacterium]